MKRTLTISALARAVKRDAGTVSRWTRRGDWTFGPPKWPASIVPKVLKWMTRLDNTGSQWIPPSPGSPLDSLELPKSSDRTDERQAKLKILTERGRLLELERMKIEGNILDKEGVMRELIARESAVAHELHTCMNLAARLVGLDEIAMRAELEKWAQRICQRFVDGEAGEVNLPPTPIPDDTRDTQPTPKKLPTISELMATA